MSLGAPQRCRHPPAPHEYVADHQPQADHQPTAETHFKSSIPSLDMSELEVLESKAMDIPYY